MTFVVVNGIVTEGPGSQSGAETTRQPELVIGLLASPGPASELTGSLAGEVIDRLAGQLPGVRWRVKFVSDRLVEPPTDLSALIAAGRRMLLERGWHLVVCVTDLPLQTARRPVIAHVSATHGVAVLSMPALGPVSVRKRTAETIVRLVGHMLGDLAQVEGAAERLPLAEAVTRRMRELGARTERGEHGVGFVARVVTGNIWLLLGMLRANRPWRLALRLMRVLAVAFAAGVFALVTSDIWRLAHYLGPLRLVVIGLGSVSAITVTIMVSTGLWERSPHPAAREQVALFNIVTAATVGLGVAALYLALFIAMLAAALLLVPGSLLGLVLRHPAGVAGQVSLAWLATSIATLGGALGAALESSESVREAAYTYQPDTQIDAVDGEIDAVDGPRLRAAGSCGLSHRRQPRRLPARMTADQGLRVVGSPGSARVGADVGRVVEQRLHDAPGLLDAVLPGEELMVAGQPGVQQPLVRFRGLAQLAGERGVQVDRAPGLPGQRGQLQPQARVRVDPQHDLVGLGSGRLGQEGQPGGSGRGRPHLGDSVRQRLAGAQQDRDVRPAPVVDLQPQRDVGLGGRAAGHAGDIGVPLVLPAHVVLRVGRGHGAEYLRLLVLRITGAAAGGWVHGNQGQDLQQVVLDHVAQRADGIVEPAAALDAEVLGHRDLHGRDARALPQLGQRQVGEPQVFQLDDRLLAEEVIDAQDLALVQQPVQPGVQLVGRGQVVAERLLDRGPALAQQFRRAELLHDGAEQGRGHLQVVQRPFRAADLRGA